MSTPPPARHPSSAPAGGGFLAQLFRSTPVTAWLIVANLTVYVVTAVQAGDPMANQRSALFAQTSLFPPLVAVGDEWWRLLTSAFDHFGPLHLLLNMYMLYLLGLGVERSVGHARYAAVYAVSALGGSAAVMQVAQNANTAGASGAIFGLMGAYAVITVALRVEARGVLLLIGLNVLIGVVVPGVSLAAHVGGLAAGALAAGALVVLPRTLPAGVGRPGREAVSWVAWLLVVALAAWVAWAGARSILPG